MTDVQERKRGRSRSPLRDNGMRATKLLKPDIGDSQGDPQTLKRVRSNSVKDLDPRSKKIRDVSSGFGLGFNSVSSSYLNGPKLMYNYRVALLI